MFIKKPKKVHTKNFTQKSWPKKKFTEKSSPKKKFTKKSSPQKKFTKKSPLTAFRYFTIFFGMWTIWNAVLRITAPDIRVRCVLCIWTRKMAFPAVAVTVSFLTDKSDEIYSTNLTAVVIWIRPSPDWIAALEHK